MYGTPPPLFPMSPAPHPSPAGYGFGSPNVSLGFGSGSVVGSGYGYGYYGYPSPAPLLPPPFPSFPPSSPLLPPLSSSSSYGPPPPPSSSPQTPQTTQLGPFTTTETATTPFQGQKPGTSGLRKKVAIMQQDKYVANFVQAIFNGVGDALVGETLVLGGDGRFYNDVVVQSILAMAGANGVGKVVVGTNGILSTPAVSALIRDLGAAGGIILTASHNPGGPDGDLGIKYNIANGGPAPDAVTNAIYQATTELTSLKTADDFPTLDLAAPCVYTFEDSDFVVEVVDSVENYVANMKAIFDFESLASLLSSGSFSMVFDAMHGVTGPYAHAIFEDELGAPAGSVINGTPKPDFGGGHPDPNLTYAHDLVELMYSGNYDFGAASDGDGDRNMILGNKFFVNPSDSVALIAAHASSAIPYFAQNPLTGFARSMPTSQAIDKVAQGLGLKVYETPTGWKYFGSLMDAGLISICGEESFGQSSVHIREKDGIWAVLAWLSILAANPGVSVSDLCTRHWWKYGRNFFTRYDYEEVDSDGARALMDRLVRKFGDWSGRKFEGGFRLAHADEFAYTDPVNGASASHQGIRFLFEDGSRIIFRLSGTGSSGATIRLYIEKYEANPVRAQAAASDVLAPLVALALDMSRMSEYTGRDAPTVIT